MGIQDSVQLSNLGIYQKIKIGSHISYQNYAGSQQTTDYGRPVWKSPSLHGQKYTPTPKFLCTAEAFFVCHIGPIFQISLIYAFIGCPLWQREKKIRKLRLRTVGEYELWSLNLAMKKKKHSIKYDTLFRLSKSNFNFFCIKSLLHTII